MKVEITFVKDFANKKKGDKMLVDSLLANQLIVNDKVAEKTTKAKKVNEPNSAK